MQDDSTTGASAAQQAGDPPAPEVADHADMRDHAARLAAFVSLESGEGRGQALRSAIRTIENVEALGAGPEADTPSTGPLAELLLDMLRTRGAADPTEAGKAHGEAAAMMLAGAAFLVERHGSVHMTTFMASMVQALQEVAARGDHPLSRPPAGVPVLPPPPDVPVVVQPPRGGMSIPARINVMGDFLRGLAPAEAQADALASMAAAATFLRERIGEDYAVGALRQVEAAVSQAAALGRWQPPEGRRAN